ncbi:arginine--tRNA ligase [Gaetbulibacter sp. M235]|uniref:arginine--tRNA ligase n=1 Tax=Gaetbulibacter sp. M235 TaxID=3126510 RepID=UPI00374E35B3
MSLQETLSIQVKQAVQSTFSISIDTVEFQATRKEFAGDITVVIFPMLRFIKGNPVQIGNDIGNYLVDNVDEVKAFNVVKGFLNIEIEDSYYIHFFNEINTNNQFGFVNPTTNEKAIMVEYSSPNTNKPLHLGHVRNNLLGYSVAEILKASGKKVYKTQIINDRGIHICKSMLAWKRFGNSETPESTGLKGDKLVGNYYVKFDQEYKKEIQLLISNGKTEDEAKKQAPILLEAQNMLLKWEAGDEETVALWKKMNQWVYDGFDITYKNLGVDFDALYYESNTYLLGKEFVAEGLKSGVFVKEEDGSVWCDLTEDGLDKKIVQRADGTAVYMTQDIGTAIQRIKDFPDVGGMVYTVGNEQDYHFKVLFLILKKLGFDWAKNLYHLSYGMVDLPSGKMKSREGTVVDADDLIDEMASTAGEISEELGKLDGYSEDEKQELYKTIGLGALKYFILKVDPKKRILFDPKESIDFQGNTGPFIQYTYARIQSIIRKADFDYSKTLTDITLNEKEKELLKQLQLFPEVIQNAAEMHSPALIANYTYDLVKEFNSFYQNVSILGADDLNDKIFRVQLSKKVALTIKNAFKLLGINVPERM